MKKSLVIVLIMSLTSAAAFSQDLSEAEKIRARNAYARAYELSVQRNQGHTCDADAYQSEIIRHLEIATTISPQIKTSAKSNAAIRKALQGNIMFAELTDQLRTPEQFDAAFAESIWYQNGGGLFGSPSILKFKPGNEVEEITLSWPQPEPIFETRKGSYTLEHAANGVTLFIKMGEANRIYRIEKNSRYDYQLRQIDSKGPGYSNEPDDCSA